MRIKMHRIAFKAGFAITKIPFPFIYITHGLVNKPIGISLNKRFYRIIEVIPKKGSAGGLGVNIGRIGCLGQANGCP